MASDHHHLEELVYLDVRPRYHEDDVDHHGLQLRFNRQTEALYYLLSELSAMINSSAARVGQRQGGTDPVRQEILLGRPGQGDEGHLALGLSCLGSGGQL